MVGLNMESDFETIDLADAHIPSLMMAIAHLTGDLTILTPERRPGKASFIDPSSSMPEEEQRFIRATAREALTKYFADGKLPIPALSLETLEEMIRYFIGDDAPDGYLPFLEEEVGVADMRRPDWNESGLAELAPKMHVVIIGAGMSGLLAAIRLQQAGTTFTILEKNPEVGGTWYENTYPGCRVDSDNQMYSYSFEPNPQWPQHFSTQDVLLDYFLRVTEKYHLRKHIRFNCKVEEARFDEVEALWTVRYTDSEGNGDKISGNALISAVGQLNTPRFPEIPGLESFAGPTFHSARWRHDIDLTGKRVAVIGTGASAFQFVPEIASSVSVLDIFQRNPPWLFPTPHYQDNVSAGQKWVLEHVPFYANWYRFWLYWGFVDGLHDATKSDPEYTGDAGAISESNAQLRTLLEHWILNQADGVSKLAGNVVPEYPVGGKRALRDNGAWFSALKRDNVHLVVDKIKEIKPQGIVTVDGILHEADVVIFGTGFRASEFLSSFRVVGRGGADLHKKWSGNARAYLGTMVPDFPNMFVIYGPNTNLVVNGSIILFAECAVRYTLNCLKLMVQNGHKTIEVREDVYDRYNDRIDRENAVMAWGLPEVSSWYKNDFGRVSQNWPFPTVDYWAATRTVNPTDFLFDGG